MQVLVNWRDIITAQECRKKNCERNVLATTTARLDDQIDPLRNYTKRWYLRVMLQLSVAKGRNHQHLPTRKYTIGTVIESVWHPVILSDT